MRGFVLEGFVRRGSCPGGFCPERSLSWTPLSPSLSSFLLYLCFSKTSITTNFNCMSLQLHVVTATFLHGGERSVSGGCMLMERRSVLCGRPDTQLDPSDVILSSSRAKKLFFVTEFLRCSE